MTPAETARLLAAAAAFDRRTIGEMDVAAWHKAIGALDFVDSVEAVAQHYATTRDWIMPSDVAAGVRSIRNRRAEATHSEALALPSKFEPDVLRDVRVSRGAAQCRDVLRPILERLQAERDAERGEVSESDQKLNLARQRAREMRREGNVVPFRRPA